MKIPIYMMIYGYEGVNDGSKTFKSMEEAEKAFLEYTGITYEQMQNDYDALPTKYYASEIICDEIEI